MNVAPPARKPEGELRRGWTTGACAAGAGASRPRRLRVAGELAPPSPYILQNFFVRQLCPRVVHVAVLLQLAPHVGNKRHIRRYLALLCRGLGRRWLG